MKRNNRRNNAKKERVIMIASSVFVLSALTLTGIYMKSDNMDSRDDGYTIDFTALEDSAENKLQEIAGNTPAEDDYDLNFPGGGLADISGLEDDLDYMPQDPVEANSGLVQIPGLTDGDELLQYAPTLDQVKPDLTASATPQPEQPQPTQAPEDEETSAPVAKPLAFEESQGLIRPLEGETLIPYSMDGGVYFTTLDHFKYNPAMMITAEQGTVVKACARGRVVDIFRNEEIGQAVTMELGNGYEITYGQLDDICVAMGGYVNAGDTVGKVAAPTKYFIREGSNLYLKLERGEDTLDPEKLFR